MLDEKSNQMSNPDILLVAASISAQRGWKMLPEDVGVIRQSAHVVSHGSSANRVDVFGVYLKKRKIW